MKSIQHHILQPNSKNSWQHTTSIQIVATLAALLHDLGKATVGFQYKLKHSAAADPYRHEWISLKLFLLMIENCDTNESVLNRLVNFEQYQNSYPKWYTKLNEIDKHHAPLDQTPSLAQWIAWLIVSHHRMPICIKDERWDKHRNEAIQPDQQKQRTCADYIENFTPKYFFKELSAFSNWVWNPQSKHPNKQQFWKLDQTVTNSKQWLNELKYWANKALNHVNLMQLAQASYINDAFLLHMSRLALMVGDHNFSSLPKQHDQDIDEHILIANTDSQGQAKQCLDEHLLGVAQYTARFARLLPVMSKYLPHLSEHSNFTQQTTVKRFMWQNHAYNLVKNFQILSDNSGFFGVNMASTGCGKTLANARIMSALAKPKVGARFTIALGLRVLTLQTGKALRERLNLTQAQLAILVGGQANNTLFELVQEEDKSQGNNSLNSLVDGFVDVAEIGIDKHEFGTAIDDSKARALLLSPLVTCTVDHLIQASENQRGGKHITPMLRLYTSDLILDEPDDFDQNDIPALARLVHLAGLLGSKVLLSSATLTPDLIMGLFNAYQAGRKIWQKQQQKADLPIVCGWFDEFNQQIETAMSQDQFVEKHNHFVSQRVAKLLTQPVRHRAKVMPLLDYQINKTENAQFNFLTLAQQLIQQLHQLHHNHHNFDPKTNKKVSVGLIRLAHTENVIAIAKAIYQSGDLPHDTLLHVVVYHAKQLLLLRSKLEEKLDRILNRSDPNEIFHHPEIRQVLDGRKETHHIFIVIGTPVTEVGRDHDYDWAIIEPSSMRSIIQLVGRVWRHRSDKIASEPNVAIIGSNLKAIKMGNSLGMGHSCFECPGFESKSFLLTSHRSSELITELHLQNINAIARIQKAPLNDNQLMSLAELEHQVMAELFNLTESNSNPNSNNKKRAQRHSNYVTSYWQHDLAHSYCAHLQLLTPFRQQQHKQVNYVCQYYQKAKQGLHFSYAEIAWQTPDQLCQSSQNKTFYYDLSWQTLIDNNLSVTPWLTCDFYQEIYCLSKYFPDKSLERIALQFATVTLVDKSQWQYHPWFGFYTNA